MLSGVVVSGLWCLNFDFNVNGTQMVNLKRLLKTSEAEWNNGTITRHNHIEILQWDWNLHQQSLGTTGGFYVSAGQIELMLVAYLDFGFTDGEFSGSSISMLSRNPVREVEREFVLVGGRGKLRMARGFASLSAYFIMRAMAIPLWSMQ
ncbi:hypothetical protein EZV62_011813 [Acer yangbiense]|uniref:Dirigent protein n=1 Tax=Acer yangbiense TaxID=1000413 RepID=A0A5C7I7R6_9ROSI|nr:hypothetical protein EZV62_011813 [Acer yangbiense]